MTTTPREWKPTPSWIRAWVPIRMSTPPSPSPSTIRRRSAAVVRLVNSSTRRGLSPVSVAVSATTRSSSRSEIPRWCCSASTAVGTMSAPWCPPWIATSRALTATTVLPEPTSPWRSRCIGEGRARSTRISSIVRVWAAVSGKPSRSWKAPTRSMPSLPAVHTWVIPRALRSRWTLRRTSSSWIRNSSSNTRRRRASATSCMDSGRWIPP